MKMEEINKTNIYALLHSFATHLTEHGTDPRHIQEFFMSYKVVTT